MKKEFTNWSKEKYGVHNEKQRPFFHEREIWFSSLGENIGFEQDGSGERFLRPIVIIKKFNNEILWCRPLTKTEKKGRYYFNFLFQEEISIVILSQIRLIDSKRLQYKVGDISKNDFLEIKRKITRLLE